MKKFLLTLLLINFIISGHSKSIALIYRGKQLSEKQNIYLDSIDVNLGYIKAIIGVKNESGKLMNVNVKKSSISIIENSNNIFCWGIYCYSPLVIDSQNAVEIPENSTNESFYAEYIPADVASGETVIEYQFYENNNPSNSASVIIHFVEGIKAGLNDYQSDKNHSVKVIKNAGRIQISSNLDKKSKLIFYNFSGQTIGDYSLHAGNFIFTLPNQLKKGIYFFSIITINRVIITQKLIVY
jgi:hypothetical protein